MYYFIPSWYGREHAWQSNDQPWYLAGKAYEFDDTVNQIRMFRNAGEAVGLIPLGYAPQLRYFLHRQTIYPLKVVPVFDRLQGIAAELAPGLLSYMDLNWPGKVEWVYTPYTVLAYLHQRKYARIEFGEDGNVLWIDYFARTLAGALPYAGGQESNRTRLAVPEKGSNGVRMGASAAGNGKVQAPVPEPYRNEVPREVSGPDNHKVQTAVAGENSNGTQAELEQNHTDSRRETGPEEGERHVDLWVRRDYYDDRGFLSSRLELSGERPYQQKYYNEKGVLQFTENRITGTVTIAATAAHPFRKQQYPSLEAMIREELAAVFRQMPQDAVVILAADARHDGMVLGTIGEQKLCLSYFEDRYDLSDAAGVMRDTARADFIVTDTGRTAHQITALTGRRRDVEDISPFDTRIALGQSQRIRELKIFMPVDGLEEIYLEKALVQVFTYMQRNERVQLLVGTRQEDEEAIDGVQRQVQKVLDAGGFTDLAFGKRVFMQPFLSENDLIHILNSTRLILDVRDQPDLYLQIAGISAGIPQVNYRYTRYVDHKKDGFIIQNIDHVTEGLEYYLSDIAHWNEAVMYCVQKVQQYTGGALVQEWKTKAGI